MRGSSNVTLARYSTGNHSNKTQGTIAINFRDTTTPTIQAISLLHDIACQSKTLDARNTPDYPRFRNTVKRACSHDMEQWLLVQVNIINASYITNDITNDMLKTVQRLTCGKSTPNSAIKDASGRILDTDEEQMEGICMVPFPLKPSPHGTI